MQHIDLHQDMASAHLYAHPTLQPQTSPTQLRSAETRLVLGTGFTLPEEDIRNVILRDAVWYESRAGVGALRLVRTKRDLDHVLTTPGAPGLLFHIEGLPGVSDPALLETWHALGVRSIGIVWNDDNLLGGGTNGTQGLTQLGITCIERMESLGILLDLAHANPQLFEDCMHVASTTPYITHGGLASLVPHKRNYTDEQLIALAERGGIVGIYLAAGTMRSGKSFTLADIANHMRQAVDLLGEDAVAFGSDFGGVLSGLPPGLACAADTPHLWEALAAHGFAPRTIEKIAFKNAARYLAENLPT